MNKKKPNNGRKKKSLSKAAKINIAIAVVGLTATVVAAITTSNYYKNILAEQKVTYETQITTLNTEIANNKRTAYVIASGLDGIKCGDAIDSSKVQQTTVYSDVAQENFITAEDLGMLARMDIQPNVPILKSMTTPDKYNEVQEVEVNYVQLNANLVDQDIVDLRIQFEDGEDFVVLAKQNLRQLDLASANFYLWLTEEELLSLNSACVDAYINNAKLYVTRYVEPALQDASIVDYQPTTDVMKRMAEDPNIVSLAQRSLSVSVRKSLEERLKQFRERQRALEEEQNGGSYSSSNGTSSATSGVGVTPATPPAVQTPTPSITESSNSSGSTSTGAEGSSTVNISSSTDTQTTN